MTTEILNSNWQTMKLDCCIKTIHFRFRFSMWYLPPAFARKTLQNFCVERSSPYTKKDIHNETSHHAYVWAERQFGMQSNETDNRLQAILNRIGGAISVWAGCQEGEGKGREGEGKEGEGEGRGEKGRDGKGKILFMKCTTSTVTRHNKKLSLSLQKNH